MNQVTITKSDKIEIIEKVNTKRHLAIFFLDFDFSSFLAKFNILGLETYIFELEFFTVFICWSMYAGAISSEY